MRGEIQVAHHVLMVMTNPVEGREDEYNTWYDTVHLPEVLQVPGFVAARRYVAGASIGAPSPYRYLAIYEIEADDLTAAVAALQAAAPTLDISGAIDRSEVSAVGFTAIGDRLTAS